MSKVRFTLNLLAVVVFTLTVASIAQAQATRTWVSGVGDDVNPCSRTAPCKTWAGAISKTAVDGEIDALDPGGFGAVTITKAITLDGTKGAGFGSILSSLVTGININIQATSGSNTVQLRNLSINGAGNGLTGVRIIGPGFANVKVFIEDCVIFGFRGNGLASRGISDERTVAGTLWVSNTMIKNNSGSAIVSIGAGGTKAVIENVTCIGNAGAGIVASGLNRTVEIRNSVASGNTLSGFAAEAGAKMDIINSLSTQNATGIDSNGATTEIRVSRTTVVRNTTNGLGFAGGTILSYGNNEVSANTGNNGPFSGGGPVLQ